jgi:hypothetical protein
MYDSPKAVHFNCLQGGKILPWNHETGLRCRWAAADMCQRFGVSDMLHADPAALARAIAEANARLNGFAEIRLRKDC